MNTISFFHKTVQHKQQERRKEELKKRDRSKKKEGLSKKERKLLRQQQAKEREKENSQLPLVFECCQEPKASEKPKIEIDPEIMKKVKQILTDFKPKNEDRYTSVSAISSRSAELAYGMTLFIEKPRPLVEEIQYFEFEP